MIFTLSFLFVWFNASGLGPEHLWRREIDSFLELWLRESVNGIRVYTNYMKFLLPVRNFSLLISTVHSHVFSLNQPADLVSSTTCPSLMRQSSPHFIFKMFQHQNSGFCPQEKRIKQKYFLQIYRCNYITPVTVKC